jgi:hypothetical protein
MSKRLEEQSAYNQFDMDHDGIVTDIEIERSEKILQIENMDKLADQQRIMAWAALFLPFTLIVLLASGIVEAAKIPLIVGLATTFCASMGTVVVAFMAATAYVRGKMSDVPKLPTPMMPPPLSRPLPPPPMPRQQEPML